MADRFLSLFEVFREKKKKSPEAAPAQQREKLEQFKPLQDDGALDQTQEEELARGHFHKTLKKFWKSPHIRRRRTSSAAAKDPAKPDLGLTELQAEPDVRPESAECTEDSDTSVTETWAKALLTSVTEDLAITNTENEETQGITNINTTPTPTMSQELIFNYFKDPSQQQQVPAKVKNIHQSLLSQVTVDAWLHVDIVKLAEEHPADVVLTLLRCAPTCDRAAAMMWRTIGSSSPTVEKVLPVLLCVMENWPLHSIFTSDGDGTDVFALAATLVLWVILQVPECHEAMNLYSPRLFVALLFHAVATTQEIPPEEVAAFWRACWQEHRLDSRLRRFVVRAMKALLCRLQWDHVLVAMERKRGWDTMMRAITQEYGLGLLAREMRRVSIPLCSHTALHLLRHLSKEKPCYDLIFLTVLVEVLECLDLSKCCGSALKTMSKYLWSECCHRHYLALRGLAVLTKDPWMARRMYPLSRRLLELLGAPDVEVVSMSLCVFMNVLQHQDILVSSTTAPKLTEALLLLFDHDNSHVRLLSIQLFCKVMDLVVDEGKKPLKTIVNKSLLALLIHCHDENWHVAKASRETLLGAAEFLKRRHLKQLLKEEQLSQFAECLVRRARKPQPPSLWS